MMADAIRVLYVDDELGLLEIAKLYLEESGEFSVTTIDSVSAALDLLRKEKFDVIISDYQMPGKDGIQFLVEVRTSFGKIPFILFTGKGREEVVIQAINNSADFYLQKGGDIDAQFAELLHKIKSATSRKMADDSLLKNAEELHAAYEELAATEEELRANLGELKSSEIRYRRFFEAVRDGILILDAETGTILDVNPFLIKLLGFTHEQFLGKKLWEIGIFKDIAASKDNFKELQDKKYIKFEDLPLETIDGRQIYSEFVSFVYDVDGKNVMQCNIRDITERKRAEEVLLKNTEELRIHQVELEAQSEELRWSHLALEESRDRFRELYEFAPIGYLTLNNKALITGANLTSSKLLGIERSKLVNHGLGRFMAPESLDVWDQYFATVRQQGEKRTCTLNLTRADGSLFPAWLEGIRLIDGEGLITVRIAISDITERKQAEEELYLANQKLNLLSSITRHDIKNKVIVIQCALQFARQTNVIEAIEPFLNEIQDSANVIERQIDFSKDYQDLGVKSPEWLNLSYMITLAGNPAIQIIDKTGTLQIFADPLFEKVLHNLVDNTIRHGETATEVYISVITEPDRIRIIWEDNGVGILAEEKEMIFDRSVGKNTGLGLFLIREILAITGMTIQETGEPGKGARFEITVPNGRYRNYQDNQD